MTALSLITPLELPLEAEVITPEQFSGKSEAEIARLPVLLGNLRAELGDFFRISGGGCGQIALEGDLRHVKRIGAGMTSGLIKIEGIAGMHLGAGMAGGEIHVVGSTGDWAGAEMRGGKITIRGDAGDHLGAAYPGSRSGMNRGMIFVEGNVGNEAGAWMRRGVIAVLGDAGDFTGAFALAGTILVSGRLGRHPGAGLKRASIVAYRQPVLLPTFAFDCVYRPAFLGLLLTWLRGEGFPVEDPWISGNYRRFSGDLTALGKGELLIYDQH